METNYSPTLSKKEFSQRISALGIKKANDAPWQIFLLALLAGLYISIGGHVFLVALSQGLNKLVAGAAFSVGLVLVVIAGAELFTGNIIMTVGAVVSRFTFLKMTRNWGVVYLGNLIASILYAFLILKSGLLGTVAEPSALGDIAIKVANAKLSLTFSECFIRGIFCNMLVILAIIMAIMSKDIISKIVCCILPIMAFVACGFEHCVANMFLIPLGLLIKGTSVSGLHIIFQNILPVTLGNIVGGLFILFIHPNRIRQLAHLIQSKYRH